MLIWAVVCIAVTGLYVGNNHAEAATTGTLTSDYVYFRKSPNGTPIKYNGSAILLRKGQKMTVLSTSNKTWYKVKLTYKKKSYTGYVYSAFIKVTRTTSKKAHLRKNENYVYFRKTPNGTPLKYNGSPNHAHGRSEHDRTEQLPTRHGTRSSLHIRRSATPVMYIPSSS